MEHLIFDPKSYEFILKFLIHFYFALKCIENNIISINFRKCSNHVAYQELQQIKRFFLFNSKFKQISFSPFNIIARHLNKKTLIRILSSNISYQAAHNILQRVAYTFFLNYFWSHIYILKINCVLQTFSMMLIQRNYPNYISEKCTQDYYTFILWFWRSNQSIQWWI